MTRMLIAYATREGHTQKIAEHFAQALLAHAIEVDVVDVRAASPPRALPSYAHVILAASLHLGKHEREMVEFVRSNKAVLDRIPTSLLSVSMSEAGVEDPKRTPEQRAKAAGEVQQTIDRFLADTGLHPGRVLPVAGALKYLEYGWIVRFVMKQISKAAGGPTDTSRDYEMTDWVGLDHFADQVARSLHEATPAAVAVAP